MTLNSVESGVGRNCPCLWHLSKISICVSSHLLGISQRIAYSLAIIASGG